MSVSLDNLEPIDVRPIKRALISVYDKTGLEDLARALGEAGVEIVSTGSTAARIAAAGVAVTPVDDVTGFPEVLEGRVKTLHPFIHSGILADQRKAAHREQIAQLGIKAFDLVVCNLYPFQDTVASGASFDECVEQIDIGGPSMVRAAAKNHPSVAVVTSPERYADVAQAVAGEGFTLEQRRALAAEAFAHTATYDLAIAGWFADELDLEDVRAPWTGRRCQSARRTHRRTRPTRPCPGTGTGCTRPGQRPGCPAAQSARGARPYAGQPECPSE